MAPLVDLLEALPKTLPKSRGEIECIQSQRKRFALAQARRAPFYQGKLDHVDADRLDDPDVWRKIPILDKETLRQLGDREFYEHFCIAPDDGIAEHWRSGGSTGTPLFYPRSYGDIAAAMVGFARIYDCTRCRRGGRAHVSFPLGIHPVGQMLARAASTRGIAVNWAGSGTTTPSALQLELIDRLRPTIWMGMSSYGLHLANLAEARGLDLAARSIETILCSAEPLSDALRRSRSANGSPRQLLTPQFGKFIWISLSDGANWLSRPMSLQGCKVGIDKTGLRLPARDAVHSQSHAWRGEATEKIVALRNAPPTPTLANTAQKIWDLRRKVWPPIRAKPNENHPISVKRHEKLPIKLRKQAEPWPMRRSARPERVLRHFSAMPKAPKKRGRVELKRPAASRNGQWNTFQRCSA